MSGFPTFTAHMTVTIEGGDRAAKYLAGMEQKAARQELLPILKRFMEPVAAEERSHVHSVSGALEAGLSARAGGGDRTGIISVFVAPSGTKTVLRKTWGGGRAQQRRWAAGEDMQGRGRRAVFYATMVEKGHRIVRRNAAGELADVGDVDPHPFAEPAVPVLEEQAEAASQAILKHIISGGE